MKTLYSLYRENKRYIMFCIAASLAFSVLVFGGGGRCFAFSDEEAIAMGGSFGALLAVLLGTGLFEGIDRNWTMIILAGTSLGSMAGHQAGIKAFDFFDRYSFGIFENPYVSIVILIWFGLPLLLKSFSKTNAIGLVLEERLKKLDGVLLLLISMSQVLANTTSADSVMAATPEMAGTVLPGGTSLLLTGVLGRGLEVVLCFIVLVLSLVVFFLTRYLFILVDIVLVPISTFIPFVSTAVVLGKLIGIFILLLTALYLTPLFIVLALAIIVAAAMLFAVAYRACRYFGNIYAKPIIKKIFGGYDKEKPLVDEKMPAKVKTFLENSNVRMAIPAYLLKFAPGTKYMHRWDRWWFVCTDTEQFIVKPLFGKNECVKLPIYNVPQQKMFINQFPAYYEIFNIYGSEESLTKVFFKIPKQFHLVFSKEYFYRYQEIIGITGFVELSQYKQYLKQFMPQKGGFFKRLGL